MWWVWIIFSFPQMLIGSRELGVIFINTAREIRGRPSKDINNISESQFNTICWTKEDFTQTQQWIDRNVLTMIPEFHTPGDTIRNTRKKFKVNHYNNSHL